MRQTLILCAITLALVGCASTANKEEYNQLAAQAENEIKLASKTGFLWLHTEKFLKESKAAMDASNAASDRVTREDEYSKAMKLDKKVSGGAIHFVLADRIGHVLLAPVSRCQLAFS